MITKRLTMRQFSISGFALLMVICQSNSADAQNLTVQQPTLSQRVLGTTLTVPDLGTTNLGGRRYGFDRRRSSLGLPSYYNTRESYRSWSGSNVGVHIHDFDAMDKALLQQETPRFGRLPSTNPQLNRFHAYRNQAKNQGNGLTAPTYVLKKQGDHVIGQPLPQSIGQLPSTQNRDNWLYYRRSGHQYSLDELKSKHQLPVQGERS